MSPTASSLPPPVNGSRSLHGCPCEHRRAQNCVNSAGIPFNYTVTGCSSANGYNSFEAILWRDYESQQGRPFLLDTMYSSDTEGVSLCICIHVSISYESFHRLPGMPLEGA